MKALLAWIGLLVVTGCGSGGTVAAVTPVMADTRGTYRLLSATMVVTAADGATSLSSDTTGTLRLFENDYQRSVGDGALQTSSGSYQLGASVNTILNGRRGAFTLSAGEAPTMLTGNYQAVSDLTLTLDYDPYALPDLSLVKRTESWVKVSDSPNHGI